MADENKHYEELIGILADNSIKAGKVIQGDSIIKLHVETIFLSQVSYKIEQLLKNYHLPVRVSEMVCYN
jgi:hypothetical protein